MRNNKLVVEFDGEGGVTLPDNRAKIYVENKIKDATKQHTVIGSGILITLFRQAVTKGLIDHTEIEFLFKGKTIPVDKYGTCKEWPNGFGDVELNATMDMLFYNEKNGTMNRRLSNHYGKLEIKEMGKVNSENN